MLFEIFREAGLQTFKSNKMLKAIFMSYSYAELGREDGKICEIRAQGTAAEHLKTFRKKMWNEYIKNLSTAKNYIYMPRKTGTMLHFSHTVS